MQMTVRYLAIQLMAVQRPFSVYVKVPNPAAYKYCLIWPKRTMKLLHDMQANAAYLYLAIDVTVWQFRYLRLTNQDMGHLSLILQIFLIYATFSGSKFIDALIIDSSSVNINLVG